MIGKNISCWIIIWSCCLVATGQSSYDNQAYKDYLKAKQQLVLLQNEGHILPLQGLDSLRIAFLSSGYEGKGNMQELLGRYLPITPLILPPNSSKAMAEAWAQEQEELFDLVILSINDVPAKEVGSNIPPHFFDHFYIEGLLAKLPSVVVLNRQSQLMISQRNITSAQAIIHTDFYNAYGVDLAAQLIFGGIATSSVLDYDLSSDYPKGTGEQSVKANRIGYAPPQAVGGHPNFLRDSIAAIIQEGIAQKAYPGAQVLVLKLGKVIYHEAFGYHTYDSIRQVTTTDIYDFASITKVTAALPALMKLYGEGQFDLDAPLKTYWPSFAKSNKSDLPFRSMLAHNARLKPWIPYWRNTVKKNGAFKPKTLKPDSSHIYPIKITDSLFLHYKYKQKMFKAIRKSPLNEQEGYKYSGLLFYILPDMLQRMVQTDFETYLKQQFYRPLGAHTITFNPYRFYPLERIIPTERDTFFRQVQIHGRVHDEGAIMMGGVSGNAGLFGSANDLAKLMQMYLNKGSYGGQQLIAAKAVEEFIRCQYCETGNRRGLGFDKPLIDYDPAKSSVARDASPRSFGHSGYTGTFAWVDPAHELIFIFFSNRVYPTRNNRALYQLNIRPRLHQAIYEALKD